MPGLSEKLAILGGQAAFTRPLHVGRPNVGDIEAFLASARDILERRWLTNDGPYVQRLEQRIEDLLGVKHCVAVVNGTVGLQLAIRALGMGGEVIVPSFTFVATAHALKWLDITPVFADIDPRTHTLDPAAVEDLVGPRTTGIIGVHVWGRACSVEGLQHIAGEHGLALMFDAAHAMRCTHRGQWIGGFGAAEVFSFHATKFMNTFEGGAVTTNDDALADRLRSLRNFGFVGYDAVTALGTNAKMSEISAAMGLVQLDALPDYVAVNRRNYGAYREALSPIPGVSLYAFDESEQNNYQYVIVEIDEVEAGLSRDELVEVLHAENVLARRYFFPGCHRMEPYATLDPDAGTVLSRTEALAQAVISLPTGTAVDNEDIERVCSLIATAVRQAPAIRTALENASHTVATSGQSERGVVTGELGAE